MNNQKNTILIIDDSLVTRELLTAALHDDYNIIEAKNGSEGISKTKEFMPDLILLDIEMPVMNGLDACKHLSITIFIRSFN